MDVNPRLVKRWAEIYVKKLIKDKAEAKAWSNNFLRNEDIQPVAEEAKIILKKLGYKVLE